MNKILLIMVFTGIVLTGNTQNSAWDGHNPDYKYIVLTNPTERNLALMQFLVRKGILKINKKNTRFLCVYHVSQAYDFQKSREYLATHEPDNYIMLEISGQLSKEDVFKENACTNDFATIFRNSIGIFFFGGPDIQPELYGEENLYSDVTDPGRHAFEVSFLYHLLGSSRYPEVKPLLEEKPDYLVTGFCLGLQTMNVATGGTLYQDIPAQVYGKKGAKETLETDKENLHRNYWQELNNDPQLMGINLHSLQFSDHPFFRKAIRINRKSQPKIYSSHHQSMKEIGTGFEITALSPDGKIIEGMAHQKFRHVFGVQFHPEVPALYEDQDLWKFSPEDEPATYHKLIGPESVKFHKKYWAYISKCLR